MYAWVYNSSLFKCIAMHCLYKRIQHFRSTGVPRLSPRYGPGVIKLKHWCFPLFFLKEASVSMLFHQNKKRPKNFIIQAESKSVCAQIYFVMPGFFFSQGRLWHWDILGYWDYIGINHVLGFALEFRNFWEKKSGINYTGSIFWCIKYFSDRYQNCLVLSILESDCCCFCL